MAKFGNPSGPLFPLGLITVAVLGEPVGLSSTPSLGTAVPTGGSGATPSTTAFGTPATGIPGLSLAGLPAQAVCMGLILTTPSANNGLTYLCYAGTAAQPGGKAAPNSVIMGMPPGAFQVFEFSNIMNPIMPGMLALDADTAGNGMYVTLMIA